MHYHRAIMRALLILLLIALASLAQSGGTKAETLKLVAAANTVDTVTSEVVVREAYARLGIEVLISKAPGERALNMANTGKVAGDVQRINNLSHVYPNLIQIRPAINYIEAAVFVTDPGIKVATWQDLIPHRIGIIRGIKFAEGGTTGMDRYIASDYAGLFRMLKRGRVDTAVSPSLNGRFQMRALGISGIHELRPAIQRFDLFHYVHKSRAGLAPKLAAEFAEMHNSGQLKAIRDHVIAKLLDTPSAEKTACLKDYACIEKGLDFLTKR